MAVRPRRYVESTGVAGNVDNYDAMQPTPRILMVIRGMKFKDYLTKRREFGQRTFNRE